MGIIVAVYATDPGTPCGTVKAGAQRYAYLDGKFYDTVGGPPNETDIAAWTGTVPTDDQIAAYLAAIG